MPDCTSTGPLQMEARYCPQGAGRHIKTGKKEEKKHKEKACTAINIVKEGQTGKQTKASTTSILDESDCWEMKENTLLSR